MTEASSSVGMSPQIRTLNRPGFELPSRSWTVKS